MAAFETPLDLTFNRGLIADPKAFAADAGAASWLFLCGEEFAATDGGMSYSDVQAAVGESANIVSDPPRVLDMDLARRHIAVLDELSRPTLVTCRTGPRSSALVYLYAGLRAGASDADVLARADADGAPFAASVELRAWVTQGLAELQPRVDVYDSSSAQYRRAFELFLAHTDQKTRARQWLDGMVASLPARRRFIDAGAGTGTVTAWLTDRFDRTLALEPNASLCEELRRACPTAEVVQQAIMDAKPSEPADLVLCSHVLYYVPSDAWQAHLEVMASWLAPGGELVIVVQSSDTDCMDMLAHFHGQRFDLRPAGERFRQELGGRYRTEIEPVPAHVTTPDLPSAVAIAEFMLNLLPMPDPPQRKELEDYVAARFAHQGGYRFSCAQDFLRIRPLDAPW